MAWNYDIPILGDEGLPLEGAVEDTNIRVSIYNFSCILGYTVY